MIKNNNACTYNIPRGLLLTHPISSTPNTLYVLCMTYHISTILMTINALKSR